MKTKFIYPGARHLCLYALLFLSVATPCKGLSRSLTGPVVIISAYNPELPDANNNISEFVMEYKALGGKHDVLIEYMVHENLSDIHLWRDRIKEILLKYRDQDPPSLIIILGPEAWSAYTAQDEAAVIKGVPVLCAMMSTNYVSLPATDTGPVSWTPVSQKVSDFLGKMNIVSGIVYEYNVDENVELIKHLYPTVRNIAFVSDNSYKGISVQEYVKEQMCHHPELNLILLDGRRSTLSSIIGQIRDLPENTAMLLGRWEVDMNDHYFSSASLHDIIDANPDVPAFTLTSAGLEHGVIGGYIPRGGTIGKDLARMAFMYADSPETADSIGDLQYIPGRFVFDYEKITSLGIHKSILPLEHEMRNRTLFMERYKYPLISIVAMFSLLLLGYLVVFYYFFRVKKLKEAAEESGRLKSAFLANMSHEIRTPLNAIVGFSNLLTEDGNVPEEHRGYAEIIQTNSDLLLRLINDILDISRLETGKLAFNIAPCEVVSLCNNVISTTQCARKATNIAFVLDAPFDSFDLPTDAQRLQQVLINLLSNAVKFTPAGGTITLGIREDSRNEMVVFSVTDTGCGIPVEKQKLVFERFEKLDEFVQGTGLGLAICKITVGLLGGEIWVDENYKDGARFEFTHPKRPKVS